MNLRKLNFTKMKIEDQKKIENQNMTEYKAFNRNTGLKRKRLKKAHTMNRAEVPMSYYLIQSTVICSVSGKSC